MLNLYLIFLLCRLDFFLLNMMFLYIYFKLTTFQVFYSNSLTFAKQQRPLQPHVVVLRDLMVFMERKNKAHKCVVCVELTPNLTVDITHNPQLPEAEELLMYHYRPNSVQNLFTF